MALDEKLIADCNEWGIRNLIDRAKWTLVGDLRELLSAAEVEFTMPVAGKDMYKKHPRLTTDLTDEPIRISISIVGMVNRHQSDLNLVGQELDLPMDSWLCLPSYKDAYLIILIIRKFLDHQGYVHVNNMTMAGELELYDYQVLKSIHNFLIPNAEAFLNRRPYKAHTPESKSYIEDILSSGFGGMATTTPADGDDAVRRLNPYITSSNTVRFSQLGDVSNGWST